MSEDGLHTPKGPRWPVTACWWRTTPPPPERCGPSSAARAGTWSSRRPWPKAWLLDPPPDFLVLDLTLPDGPGEAILWKVRGDCLTCRVAVCTGTHDPQRLAALRLLSPDVVLHKPCKAEEFATPVESI